MVTPILKCNSINNPLIISTGIGDFKFWHSLGHQLSLATGRFMAMNIAEWSLEITRKRRILDSSERLINLKAFIQIIISMLSSSSS